MAGDQAVAGFGHPPLERDLTLRRLRRLRTGLVLLAVALAAVTLWLTVDNPAIRHTTRGDPYSCLAPWDTVLNDADNYPGGEPPPDGDQIEERCREAGEARFQTATTVGLAAGGAALAAGVVGVITYRRDRRPAPEH